MESEESKEIENVEFVQTFLNVHFKPDERFKGRLEKVDPLEREEIR